MEKLFYIVYKALLLISEVTGFSYNEVNVIAYYFILPFFYVVLFDRILRTHLLKVLYLAAVILALIVIPDFEAFSDWLFAVSVEFLTWFEALGWNYVVASVLICVIFPGIAFLVLFHFAYPRFFSWLRNRYFGSRGQV